MIDEHKFCTEAGWVYFEATSGQKAYVEFNILKMRSINWVRSEVLTLEHMKIKSASFLGCDTVQSGNVYDKEELMCLRLSEVARFSESSSHFS
jgi:hypothetical protein